MQKTVVSDSKQLFETEMDNFFSLFRRYLNDKAKGNEVYIPLPLPIVFGMCLRLIWDFQDMGPHRPPCRGPGGGLRDSR